MITNYNLEDHLLLRKVSPTDRVGGLCGMKLILKQSRYIIENAEWKWIQEIQKLLITSINFQTSNPFLRKVSPTDSVGGLYGMKLNLKNTKTIDKIDNLSSLKSFIRPRHKECIEEEKQLRIK